jgi:tRNA(Ile)-lysidine synthetase-like protein
VAVQRRVLAIQLVALGQTPEFDLVEHLRLEPDARRMVGPATIVWRNANGHLETGAPGSLDFESDQLELRPADAGTARFGGLRIRWNTAVIRRRPGPFRPPSPRAGTEMFDADAVGGQIRLRHWRPGDRFQPSGMPRPVKLQNLFTNQRVPAEVRRRVVVAEASDGRLFWVQGLRISECFKLDKTSHRRLNWRWARAESSDVRRSRT